MTPNKKNKKYLINKERKASRHRKPTLLSIKEKLKHVAYALIIKIYLSQFLSSFLSLFFILLLNLWQHCRRLQNFEWLFMVKILPSLSRRTIPAPRMSLVVLINDVACSKVFIQLLDGDVTEYKPSQAVSKNQFQR